MATTIATRSAVYRFSVISLMSGLDTSSRRCWLEDTYASSVSESGARGASVSGSGANGGSVSEGGAGQGNPNDGSDGGRDKARAAGEQP